MTRSPKKAGTALALREAAPAELDSEKHRLRENWAAISA
jgi:hypothetical protein